MCSIFLGTAKEFIEIYAVMNNLKPLYRTMLFGQKTKGFVSTLTLNDKKYRLYPDMKRTEELAEEEVAKKAMADIKERKGNNFNNYHSQKARSVSANKYHSQKTRSVSVLSDNTLKIIVKC